MSENSDVIDAIAANLAQPRRARTDAGEVEQHELDRQVAAAEFVLKARQSQSSGSPFGCLRFAQCVYPGAS